MDGWEAACRRRMMKYAQTASTKSTARITMTVGRKPDDDEACVLATLALEPVAVAVAIVVGGDVADFGSTTLSSDSAVPEWQFTGPPPTACQVSPVTRMSRPGYWTE